GQSFLNDPARQDEVARWKKFLASIPNRKGMTNAVKGVLTRGSFYDQLGKISVPTQILVGEEDVATTPDKSERMAAAIAHASLVRIPKAGHQSNVDAPEAVNQAIGAFLEKVGK
ncbi:MAG TPA: alpha/beta hydrolase, partial [Aliiroseovarius sp.]|nr:alpha/beta hydrolase [Aliiroseovarius sp.]